MTAPLPVPVSVVCPRCKGSGVDPDCARSSTKWACGGHLPDVGCGGSGLVPALLPAREVERLLRERVKALPCFSVAVTGDAQPSEVKELQHYRSHEALLHALGCLNGADVLAALGCPEET